MTKLQYLEELIRSVSNYLLTTSERIEYVTKPDIKKRLFIKYPECFLSLRQLGADTTPYLIPICNRAGIIDPLIISISYRVVSRLLKDNIGEFDVNELTEILAKLDRLKARYQKEIPKPPMAAARKAIVTKMFNNIKQHLQIIGPKE